MNDKDLRTFLRRDPLAEAEQATGKSYKDDDETMQIGFVSHLFKTQSADRLLKERGDTRFSMTTEDYLAAVRDMGFEQVLHVPFIDEKWSNEDESLFILFHEESGALLSFDTFKGNRNGGSVYYNWKPRLNEEGKPADGWHDYVSSGGFTDQGSWVWYGNHDCREALSLNLRGLAEHGEFVSPWIKSPFLWLLHHGDSDKKGYDYKTINASRIVLLPNHVRKAITPCETKT